LRPWGDTLDDADVLELLMALKDWPWPMISALLAGAVLLISLWANFLSAPIRRLRLKKPARAYFHIRSVQDNREPLGYVMQNDHAHNVKEIVLPADAEIEVEVSYYPKMPFNVQAWVFGIDGELGIKPTIVKKLDPFVAKRVSEKEDPYVRDLWDRKGNYHSIPPTTGRSVGSCYTTAFLLHTHQSGVYKAWLGFLTDEVDGTLGDLVIRVEDKPSTVMRCKDRKHWLCKLRPRPLRS